MIIDDSRMRNDNDHQGMDPTVSLDDCLLAYIFSFLGGGTKPAQVARDPCTAIDIANPHSHNAFSVQEAARLHSLLASVCQRWRLVCDYYLKSIVGLVEANITRHKDGRCQQPWLDRACIQWMCYHGIQISTLPCAVLWLNDEEVPLFVQLLHHCNTTQLRRLWISFTIDFWRNSSREKHLILQRQIYDTIAASCPNLEEASIGCRLSLWLVGQGRDPYNTFQAFFSMPSLRRLHWTIDCHENTHPALRSRLGPAIVTRLIANLPALERLELREEAGRFLGGCLPIQSDHLRVLDLCHLNLKKPQVGVLCLCPRLLRVELPYRDTVVQHFETDEDFQLAIANSQDQFDQD